MTDAAGAVLADVSQANEEVRVNWVDGDGWSIRGGDNHLSLTFQLESELGQTNVVNPHNTYVRFAAPETGFDGVVKCTIAAEDAVAMVDRTRLDDHVAANFELELVTCTDSAQDTPIEVPNLPYTLQGSVDFMLR
ncbi:hypothetical protein V8J82_16495 [Gymnodinialimonas sp. 2305UL16-5]|uniref:hypothetical protein n=1 Tax=Gymnodinialimonas mytili TaxID=3126503 RepID=UPI00309A7D76